MANIEFHPSVTEQPQAIPAPVHPIQNSAQSQIPALSQPVMIVAPAPSRPERKPKRDAVPVKIYSHSTLFYWWPVWAVGYITALMTYAQGKLQTIGGTSEWFSTNSGPGVVFFLTLFLVILLTNVTLRGKASGMVILSAILATVVLAYMNLWDTVLKWLGGLSVHLNLGAYLWFSTLLFGTWALTVFVFDHLTYWRIRAGQITRESIFGTTSKSYDTDGMMLEKDRDDLFRHWVLGLGAGDLHIQTTGANRDRIDIRNVLFIGSKIESIQKLIAIKPDEFGRVVLK